MPRLARLSGFVVTIALASSAQAQMTHDHTSSPPSSAAPFGPPVEDQHIFYHAVLNQLEGRFGSNNSFRWEGEAWGGTDENRIWLKSEGELSQGLLSEGIQQLFYSRAVSTYFDAQVGARYDLDSLPGRGWVRPLLSGRDDTELMFKYRSLYAWIRRRKITMSKFKGCYLPGDLRKFAEQYGDIIGWDQSNRAYILTHGVSGVDWSHYKHPLPENVYSIYMKSWKDVALTCHR
ncbi:MAG: copper resistance protein B [Halobacteriota archaeon]